MDTLSHSDSQLNLGDKIAAKINQKLEKADTGLMYVPVEGMEVRRDGVVDARDQKNDALLRHADHAAKGGRQM